QTGDVFAAGDPPDLRKYLTPDGRFIDRCAYWKDNPDSYTLMYGQPDHFAAGQPMGSTQSVNGTPPPYGRCSEDPCDPGGYMCWRNPGAKGGSSPVLKGAADMLREKGCTTDGVNISCPAPKVGPPGSPTLSGGVSKCHFTPTGGIACDGGDDP